MDVTELISIVTFLIIVAFSFIVCNSFLLTQLYEAHGSSIQPPTRSNLADLGTRFEAVGGIISLSSIDCLGCEFRGIVEKLSEFQYNISGEVTVDSISSIIPVSVLGTLNVNASAINGTLSISDKQYTVEGTSTAYSPTCDYCEQTLNLRGQSVHGGDVMSANIPLNSIE